MAVPDLISFGRGYYGPHELETTARGVRENPKFDSRATLEAELLSRRRFASQAEACMACFSYIEGWYNPVRLHSGLGYRSPMAYEADMEAALTTT